MATDAEDSSLHLLVNTSLNNAERGGCGSIDGHGSVDGDGSVDTHDSVDGRGTSVDGHDSIDGRGSSVDGHDSVDGRGSSDINNTLSSNDLVPNPLTKQATPSIEGGAMEVEDTVVVPLNIEPDYQSRNETLEENTCNKDTLVSCAINDSTNDTFEEKSNDMEEAPVISSPNEQLDTSVVNCNDHSTSVGIGPINKDHLDRELSTNPVTGTPVSSTLIHV